MDHFERILEILEFVDNERGQVEKEILKLVKLHCKEDFEVLKALKQYKPEFCSTENLIDAFSESSVVGPNLTEAMKEFNLKPGLVEVLELCSQLDQSDQKPTFAQIHSASKEKTKALELCKKFIHSACLIQQANVSVVGIVIMNKLGLAYNCVF